MFRSGLAVHPGSQPGQPEKDVLLIIALPPVMSPNGASPPDWKAMKFRPQLLAGVHWVMREIPCGGMPADMTSGSSMKVLPVTETLRASHWQPSQ